MRPAERLTIGHLAESTGISVSALRYYDELGLISPSERIGGKRHFDAAAVGRINFIRRAQGVGFSLGEIHDILDDTVGEWNSMVVDKLAILHSQRSELDTMIGILEEVRECGCQVVAECERLIDPC